jgi:hypothetical protein
MRGSLTTLLCMTACVLALNSKNAAAAPFDYLPLAQSARIRPGPAMLATYTLACIEPRQSVATGRAWRSKLLIRPSIAWQYVDMGVEAGAKVALSMFYSQVDWNPYIKLGVGQRSPLAVAMLLDLEIKRRDDTFDFAPRVTAVASYTIRNTALYAAGDLTIRDDIQNWGAELGMEIDVSQHFSIVGEARIAVSQYWKSYVAGIGSLFHF